MDEWSHLLVAAYMEALESPDPSTQNGAVLVDENGLIIGRGCNHFNHGTDPAYWHGDKESKYLRVVHAELSAIFDASRYGEGTQGSTLVCPWAACSNCAKNLVAAGVTRLVRYPYSNSGVTTGSHWYADCQIGDEIMLESGVEIIEVPPVKCSVILRRDGKEWTP